jgi:hypothetical protein
VTAPTPTGEQKAIIDACQAGGNLVIEAGAGTGKTSTLRLVAATQPRRRGLYVAYNKAIASDAKRSFPGSVTCATAHSLAFRAVGRRFAHRLSGPRLPARQTAKALGITRPLAIPHVGLLAPQQVARLVVETITRFCHSDAAQVEPWHIPKSPGLEDPATIAVLREALVPLA